MIRTSDQSTSMRHAVAAWYIALSVISSSTAPAQRVVPFDTTATRISTTGLSDPNAVFRHFFVTTDQFETTAHYDDRLLKLVTGDFYAAESPNDASCPTTAHYDADRATLTVAPASFDDSPVSRGNAVLIRCDVAPLGSYVASNAMGAKTRILRARKSYAAIGIGRPSSTMGRAAVSFTVPIKVPADSARYLFNHLRVVVAFNPSVQPTGVFASSDSAHHEATFTEPYDVHSVERDIWAHTIILFVIDSRTGIVIGRRTFVGGVGS